MLSLRYLIASLANAYSTIIVVYVLMSWIPMGQTGIIADIYRVLGKICDPFLKLFKKLVPPIGGMLDITPILALVVLQCATTLILRII